MSKWTVTKVLACEEPKNKCIIAFSWLVRKLPSGCGTTSLASQNKFSSKAKGGNPFVLPTTQRQC